ncbi:MAG: hypothetical protein EOM26_12580 [Alphaproteobacteria bacterium]|nr:hypothetical protein [Alphaproteobacteria bacterium]
MESRNVKTIEITPETEAQARALLETLQAQLGSFESFVARRFDELSTEINATAQQMDMVESGLSRRFGDIIGILGAISYHGTGTSPVNTGVELDAVIKTTEDAANTILDAADQIADSLRRNIDWANESERGALLDSISGKVQEILLACTFQDLTGQRISKAIENLRTVEAQLSSTLQALGIEIEPAEGPVIDATERVTSQADIDALFKDSRA